MTAPGANPAPAGGQPLALRDIQPPADPPWWPPAPGWWLLALLLLAGLAAAVATALRLWRRRRLRRRVYLELERLRGAHSGVPARAAAVSALLKRVALARYDRAAVAGLSGEAWLRFLDRTGGRGRFAEGPGRALADAPYRPEGDAVDLDGLIAVARDWVRRNL